LVFAYRRTFAEELQYDERGKPSLRIRGGSRRRSREVADSPRASELTASVRVEQRAVVAAVIRTGALSPTGVAEHVVTTPDDVPVSVVEVVDAFEVVAEVVGRIIDEVPEVKVEIPRVITRRIVIFISGHTGVAVSEGDRIELLVDADAEDNGESDDRKGAQDVAENAHRNTASLPPLFLKWRVSSHARESRNLAVTTAMHTDARLRDSAGAGKR